MVLKTYSCKDLQAILKIVKVIIYTKKLLNSDWLRKECSSPVTRVQFCNTSANYKWFLIGLKHKRNQPEPNRLELFKLNKMA